MDLEAPKPPPEQPVEIPADALGEDVLRGIVREFILREGTDYGAVEVGLDTKIQQVLRQIAAGDVKIFFDAATETVNLTRRKT